ncbi:MAG TPA: 3-oxoacyl-ACP reductase family protein [Actinomycetota bacterium]|nr:3-oxoacyl-ACP reductase family protein [Actinomycetota bacterium]
MSAPRNVIVTGGSRGLGAGLVQMFLDQGDRVATCSRTPSEQTDAWSADPASTERFLYASVDVADGDACRTFVRSVLERFGGIDILVNNAGVARDGVLGTFAAEDIDTVVNLNVKGTIHMTKPVVRAMLRSRAGRVINISSVVGRSGYRGLSVYGATKAAIEGFTRGLARELGSRGIAVNCVAPGYLRTEMTHGLNEEQLEQIVRRTPLGRLGEVEDVAGMVRYLASDEAAFVTGQVFVVDGGLTT